MVTGQRKTGEVGGDEARVGWVWVWWMEWFGFTVQHSGWMDYFSLFLSIMVAVVAFSLYSPLCVPPLLLSFSSLLCLLSCLRAVVISLFVLQCSVLPLPTFSILCFIPLSSLRRVGRPFVIFHLHRHPLPPSSPISCSPPAPAPLSRSQSYCILYIRV